VPYLNRAFQACIKLSKHTDEFKSAFTSVLQKPEKLDYDLLKSYRPVVLLPHLGKNLEKIIANHFAKLCRPQAASGNRV
jgi:hypothetical protein